MSIYIQIGFTEGFFSERKPIDENLNKYKNINQCNQSIYFGIEYPWKEDITMFECNIADGIYKIEDGFFLCSLKRENFRLYLSMPKTINIDDFHDKNLYNFIEKQSGKNGIISNKFKQCITEEENKDTDPKKDWNKYEKICGEKHFSKFKLHVYIPSIHHHIEMERIYVPTGEPNYEQRTNDLADRWHGQLLF
jgi:hypothetical protein